ncbi:MAG TPA: caspase family protein, partial [Candidatus Polarisedimenticolaceae bacterium]|nr:caspase family protein [Candidatus Polarisedimenticolaceae bacterium]
RALLVGIDVYRPAEAAAAPAQAVSAKASKGRGTWTNLDGAVNDVRAMRELLIAAFGFAPGDIVVLENAEATRERILAEFRRQLIDPAQPGDVGIFYYAGHGSQMANSQSTEADGKDETIVPADSYLGAWDIRDKTLSRLLNDAVDKGEVLTVLFDSCHSGSIGRGPASGKARTLPADPRDAAELAEPTDARPAPETRRAGALVLSAAQDYQVAMEAEDDEGHPHGAFSVALQEALRGGTGLTAEAVFKRVKALMQVDGRPQEPVLAGPPERVRGPLFGGASDAKAGGITVAALRVLDEGKVELQGGLAVGLQPGTELVRVAGGSAGAEVRIEVDALDGLTRATAHVVRGDSAGLKTGDLFRVENWVAPPGDRLSVWAPRSGPKAEELLRLARELSPLREQVRWVEDPTREPPTHELFWDGSGWSLSGPDGRATSLGRTPTRGDVAARLKPAGAKPVAFFLDLPPTAELAAALDLRPDDGTRAVTLARSRDAAHYVLMGRSDGSRLEYAWVLPAAALDGFQPGPLPGATAWIEPAQAARLGDFAARLGKVRGWLGLEGPAAGETFPYTLALKNQATGEYRTDGTLLDGESYRLVLRADPAQLSAVERRFVYVFVLDRDGNSTLLFPRRGQGNVENRLPVPAEGSEGWPAEIPLGGTFKIGTPYGVDTYIVLTSHDALPDPDVLQVQGVTGGASRGGQSPLARLIQGVNGASRGVSYETPTDWSLQRVSLESRQKPRSEKS